MPPISPILYTLAVTCHSACNCDTPPGACAGPSATTANALSIASLLGFAPAELVVMRLALLAWMLGSSR